MYIFISVVWIVVCTVNKCHHNNIPENIYIYIYILLFLNAEHADASEQKDHALIAWGASFRCEDYSYIHFVLPGFSAASTFSAYSQSHLDEFRSYICIIHIDKFCHWMYIYNINHLLWLKFISNSSRIVAHQLQFISR